MPSAKGLKNAKTAGIIGAVVIVLGILIAIIWIMRRGLTDLFSGTAEAAGGLARGLGGVGSAVGDIGQGFGNTTRVVGADVGQVLLGIDANPDNLSQKDFSDDRPTLVLTVLEKKDLQPSPIRKGNRVKVRVTARGQRIPNAMITTNLLHFLNRVGGNNRLAKHFTNEQGEVEFSYFTMDQPGAGDDDAELVATKKGYNPSNRVVVR